MPIRSLERELTPTPRVRVRSWRHETQREGWPSTAHPAVEVAIVRHGAVTYGIGRRDLHALAGMAIIVPAGVEHAGALEPDTRATSLHVDVDLMLEIARAMEHDVPDDAVLFADSKRLAILVELLESEASHTDPGSALASEALVEAIAVEMLRALGKTERRTRGPSDPRIRAAVQKIESDYPESINVDALARSAHMSRFHFSRAFQAAMGRSPYRYLIDTRVARAAERLRSGRTSVTEAALSVGFHDLGRFSRAFRRKMGLSPAQWVSTHRA
jgi:AraC-like DNA-binding protein